MAIKIINDNQRFGQYLESKDLAAATIGNYSECIDVFLGWIEKELIQITKPDILSFLEHLKGKGLENKTRQKYLTALNHYFMFLFDSGEVATNPTWGLKIRGTNKKRLHKIYTPQELQQLCDDYYNIFVCNFESNHTTQNQRPQIALCKERNAVMLSVFVNQGVNTKEISNIELGDLNLKKATIKIRGSKTGSKRVIPLNPTQKALFSHYLKDVRPQILEYYKTFEDNNKLFLPMPDMSHKEDEELQLAFCKFTKQIKSIDKKFTSFKQLRTSVITNWLKLYDLRKTQYLAGHKYIRSTERYKPNNIDNLTRNINNLHPF
jgi:site-specific recombinase XerD